MNGTLSQIAALTCHGNASIGGMRIPNFFPGNSTTHACEVIAFVEHPAIGGESADAWLAALPARGTTGIRLVHKALNDFAQSDRRTAVFAGGGGTWMMEALHADGHSEFWAARTELGNRDAPDRRIWRVTMGLVGRTRTRADRRRSLSAVTSDLDTCLKSIHAFAVREHCDNFARCFANALQCLAVPDSPSPRYPQDLAPPGLLDSEQSSLFKASMHAWVFGGMGSWNDVDFNGATRLEYENLSDSLFNLLNEAVAVAVSSTAPCAAR